jgi:hypothetical protein
LLEELLPSPEPFERIELRAELASGRVVQRWASSPEGLLALVSGLHAGSNLWFGPALRAGAHGDAAHVTRLRALWCDVDAKCYRGGTSDAHEAITALRLRPSAVVDTGGGLHAYWFLSATILALEQGNDARAAMRGVRAALDDGADTGLDRVDDLSRVLRLPGSRNQKYEPPAPVVLVSMSGYRYALDDFRDAQLWDPLVRPRPYKPVHPRPLAPPRSVPRWVDQALSHPDQFVRRSPSELDFAVVCRLVELVGPQQAEAIWLSSALGTREKVQARADYRERTIRAALAATLPEKSEGTRQIRIKVG